MNQAGWIECVLNFSEGRRPDIIEAVVRAVSKTAGVFLLGTSSDPDHNRSVLTFVSRDATVVEAAFEVVVEAEKHIDIRRHDGVHPCIGAVDVIPFVSLGGTPQQVALSMAELLARRLGSSLDLPVYLYEQSATQEHRRNLSDIRRGGIEGLAARMSSADWQPDFGPPRPHPRLGATAVGARRLLIAFNIYLSTDDVEPARRIARRIRESSGGLPAVRALGLYLQSRRQSQVSMNLVDFRKTGLRKVFEEVSAEAASLGIEVASSQIIGFVPRASLGPGDLEFLRLENRGPVILEDRIRELTGEE